MKKRSYDVSASNQCRQALQQGPLLREQRGWLMRGPNNRSRLFNFRTVKRLIGAGEALCLGDLVVAALKD